MSEFHPHSPEPDESPHDDEARTADAHLADELEDEQARGARYYREATQLYLAHVQKPDDRVDHLEPSTEAWVDFESRYEGSFEDTRAFVQHVMCELGWHRLIQHFSAEIGIPTEAIQLDYGSVYRYLSRYFHIYRTPEQVLHVFTREGIKPMAPDIARRGGQQ